MHTPSIPALFPVAKKPGSCSNDTASPSENVSAAPVAYVLKYPILLQEAHAEVVPHAEEDPHAPKAAPTAEEKEVAAPAAEETMPAAEPADLAPAASAASDEPIAEAVVALQQVLEPEPVPEMPAPAPEGAPWQPVPGTFMTSSLQSFLHCQERVPCWTVCCTKSKASCMCCLPANCTVRC